MTDPTHCITCSDEAVEGIVVDVAQLTAVVRVGELQEPVGIDLVPDAAPGDVLLCHAGIALELIARGADARVAESHKPGVHDEQEHGLDLHLQASGEAQVAESHKLGSHDEQEHRLDPHLRARDEAQVAESHELGAGRSE